MNRRQAASDVLALRKRYHSYVRRADAGDRSTAFAYEIRTSFDSLVCLLDEVDDLIPGGGWSRLADSYEELLRRVAQ